MNNIVKVEKTSVPAYLRDTVAEELALNKDAMNGISGSDYLPSLSIKGKCFSIRHNGETQPFDTPTLDVVIIASRPTLSKVKYASNYNPKETVKPECASIDSVTADFDTDLVDPATGKCCHNCQTCYFNQFGSSTQGVGKACKDYKRLVVMIASQDGKTFPANAPALILDVPATSLKAPRGTNLMMLRECVSALQSGGVPLSAYVVTLRFVMTSEYPQIVFEPKRWVIPEEMERIKVLRESDALKTVLEERHTKPAKEGDAESATTGKPAEGVEKAIKKDLFASATPVAQQNAVNEVLYEDASVKPTPEEEAIMAEAEAMLEKYNI